MTADVHERWSDDLAAFLLGALEPGEAAEVERHLEECERCQAEVRWLKPAIEALSECVARLDPPGELRARLLAEVRTEAAEEAAKRSEATGAGRSIGARLRGLGLALTPASALAALALFLLAGAFGYAVGNSGSGTGVETTTVVAGHAPGVTARLLRAEGKGVLRLTHVHALGGGRVLEAWVERNGRVAPVRALFVPNRGGLAEAIVGDVRGAEAVLVTVEPSGGVPQPTSEPIVAVPIRG
jgi:anti-sigma factor RsiW